MFVRINNVDQGVYNSNDYVKPLQTTSPVLVVIDPGKTNMAVLIGTVGGQPLAIIELSGKNCDTTQYCRDFKKYFGELLSSVRIERIIQEKTILPGDKKAGQNYISVTVLNEIRSAWMDYSMSRTGQVAKELNNWAWKKSVLPEGYRSIHGKGSKQYLMEVDYRYAEYTHDVTDVICMYMHEVKMYNRKNKCKCLDLEKCNKQYKTIIAPVTMLPSNLEMFEYNEEYTVEENANYYCNRRSVDGEAVINLTNLGFKDIADNCSMSIVPSDKVALMVKLI